MPREINPRLAVLIRTIETSIALGCFRNYYTSVDGKPPVDVLEDGRLSCAVYVSHVLSGNMLVPGPRARITKALEDMRACGWKTIPKRRLRPGAVLVWEKKYGNRHIGFAVRHSEEPNKLEAVSNCPVCRVPLRHPFQFEYHGRGRRVIEQVFWHPLLGEVR